MSQQFLVRKLIIDILILQNYLRMSLSMEFWLMKFRGIPIC